MLTLKKTIYQGHMKVARTIVSNSTNYALTLKSVSFCAQILTLIGQLLSR